MVLSNMGTIVLSLPSTTSQDNASNQVRILSLSNTLSRIVVGPFADFVSPSGGIVRKHRVSRIAFLFAASILLCVTSLWTVVGIRTQEQLWILRSARVSSPVYHLSTLQRRCWHQLRLRSNCAVSDSISFLLPLILPRPSVVSSIWGPSNAARNFGVVAYAPAIGTPIYSYLYAFISSNNAGDSHVCKGPSCWITTFSICSCSSFLGIFCSVILWHQWKGRL